MINNANGHLFGYLLLNVKRTLKYPAAIIGSFASTMILFILQVSLWKYTKLGEDEFYIVSYFTAVALLRPFLTIRVDRRLQSRHGSGDILYDTIRPLSLARLHVMQDVSSALVSFTIVSIPAVIVIDLFSGFHFTLWSI